MDESDDKAQIGMIRDSALSMNVGDPAEGAVQLMISMDAELYVVLSHAIYSVRLADQIDPERLNPAVPNTKQRILRMGSHDAAVGRIFLTANALFKTVHLGQNFPEVEARSSAFSYLRDVAAMVEMFSSASTAIEKAASAASDSAEPDRSFELPAIGDAGERFDSFAQKTGHAIDELKTIARLFYPDRLSSKWIDSLIALAAEEHGEDSALAGFTSEVRDQLLLMRELRNLIEHPKPNSYVNVRDFELTPEMKVSAPCVDIVRTGKKQISEPLLSLMNQIIEELISIGETLIALLCGENAESFTGFPLTVVEVPPSMRPKHNPHQRISYGIEIDGKVQPLG